MANDIHGPHLSHECPDTPWAGWACPEWRAEPRSLGVHQLLRPREPTRGAHLPDPHMERPPLLPAPWPSPPVPAPSPSGLTGSQQNTLRMSSQRSCRLHTPRPTHPAARRLQCQATQPGGLGQGIGAPWGGEGWPGGCGWWEAESQLFAPFRLVTHGVWELFSGLRTGRGRLVFPVEGWPGWVRARMLAGRRWDRGRGLAGMARQGDSWGRGGGGGSCWPQWLRG